MRICEPHHFKVKRNCSVVENILIPTETVILDRDNFDDSLSSLACHIKIAEAMPSSTSMVIWDCSLDAYDAEIQSLMAESFYKNDRLRRIFIVDPNFTEVSNKARFLGRSRNNIEYIEMRP